jgi:hypothetical protein
MCPSKSRFRYPLWVRITCCLVPVVCVLALCIAAIFGAAINWPVAASITGLCVYVVKTIV